MAEPGDVEFVRDLVNEPDNSNGWTDDKIGEYIDRFLNLNKTAGNIWLAKAGSYATLVDVSESGSARKLSSLQKNALEMYKLYKGLGDTEEENETKFSAPFTVPIRRP